MKVKRALFGVFVVFLALVLYVNAKSIAFDTANLLINGKSTYQTVALADEFGTTIKNRDGTYYAATHAPTKFMIATAPNDHQNNLSNTEYLADVFAYNDTPYRYLQNS